MSTRHLRAQVQANSTIIIAVTLLVISGLALFLRLILLGQDSFWGDEILTVRRAQLTWENFWDLILNRGGLPAMTLYYLMMRFWVLLGDSEFTVRLLSVVFAVATVPLFYLLGKRLFDAKIGLIAALLLAVNAFHIQYSQEARSYTLLVLLVTLSSLFLVRAIQRPSWGNWAGYVLPSALAVYSHWFALLAIAAQLSSLVFLPKRELPWRWLIISGIALSIALTPIGASVSGEVVDFIVAPGEDERVFTHAAVAETSWHRVHNFAVDMTGKGGNLLLIVYLIPVVVSSVTAVRKWMSTGTSFESWKYALLLSWLIFPIAVTIGYSLLVEPAFVDRYLTICLPPLVMLASVGVYQIYRLYQLDPIRVPVVSGVLVVLLVGLSTRGASAYYAESEKEDWRGVTRLVASQWQPGDQVLFYVPWTNLMFDFYLQRLEAETPEIEGMIPYRQWRDLTRTPEEGTREAIVQRLPNSPGRVWLVQGRVFTPERLEVSHDILAALACKYQPVKVQRFTEFSKVEVVLFQRQGAANVARRGAKGGCNELAMVKALQSNIIEDFENASDVGVYWGRGADIDARPVPGVKDQGYQIRFSEGGWWDIVKVTPPVDPDLYQGVSLALKGSGDVRLQLRERQSSDGRGGERWNVDIILTEQWRTLSYAWSDFHKEAGGSGGNGVLDLDLVESVRLKQGDSLNGFVAIDEWVFELVEKERVEAAVSPK